MSRPLPSPARPHLSAVTNAGSSGPIPDGAEALALKAADGAGELLVGIHSPASFEADQYRVLRHHLERMRPDGRLGVIAVTSAGAGDGKTTTALNLAGMLAQTPAARVLLVDVDLRLSSVGVRLGVADPDGAGLADAILDENLSLRSVEHRLVPFNLSVVTAGRRPASACEALRSPRMAMLLDEARQRYEHVILDAPPILPVPDSRVLAPWVDGFVLVVAAHRTPRRFLAEALSAMDPGKVLGFVFNGADRPSSGYYGNYYGYRAADRTP